MSTRDILRRAACLLAFAASVGLTPAIQAETSVPYKISMSRADPAEPLRKSTIMARVKERWPGRILSIVENDDGGQDCHIVKLMGDDGEFRIIHVACK